MFGQNNKVYKCNDIEDVKPEPPRMWSTERINDRESRNIYSDGTCHHFVTYDDGEVICYRYKLSREEMERMKEELKQSLLELSRIKPRPFGKQYNSDSKFL